MTNCLKTYILQFLYKDGNGWAIVNARTPLQAENIFKIQTKFTKPKVTSIKESKWYGENMQLVYEGTTITGNLSPYDLAVMEGYVGSLDQWLKSLKGEKGDTFTYEDLTPEQLDEIGEHVPVSKNNFIVTFHENQQEESVLIADKTFNETLSALNSGKIVWFVLDYGDGNGLNMAPVTLNYGNMALQAVVWLDDAAFSIVFSTGGAGIVDIGELHELTDQEINRICV